MSSIARIALFLSCSGIYAQTRPTFESFEVATIKPSKLEASAGRFIRMQSANQFVARNYPVRVLIAAAYNLNIQAISGGPDWIDSDRYEIVAQSPGEVRPTLDEQMSMLRDLLADRFGLKLHRAPRELSIYALTVAANGPRLKENAVPPESAPEGSPPLAFVIFPEFVRLPGRNATMQELASVMQRAALDRPVLNQTGLPGRYDFDLEFAPDESLFGGALPKNGDTSKPSFFTAIQEQLGLKLTATKGLVDSIVIDRIERPSEN